MAFELSELMALLGLLVGTCGLLNLGFKMRSKLRANQKAAQRLRLMNHAELARLSKILHREDLDPVEFEKILKRIESLLRDGLDKKSLEEINEALYQRSSRGRVDYAASLLQSATSTELATKP
jgi:hypothetical protein